MVILDSGEQGALTKRQCHYLLYIPGERALFDNTGPTQRERLLVPASFEVGSPIFENVCATSQLATFPVNHVFYMRY